MVVLVAACGGSPVEASSISASGSSGGDDGPTTMTADDSVSASLTEPTMSASAEDASTTDPTAEDATAEDPTDASAEAPTTDDAGSEDAGDSSAGDATQGTTTASDDSGTTTDDCVPVDELCDDVDNDCDGVIDEGSPSNLLCQNCVFTPSADGGSYFALCGDFLTWDQARTACANFGAGVDLATIDNGTDQATLLFIALGDTWIGISDLVETGHWVWVDGTDSIAGGVPVGYDGWAVGQPEGLGEHCAELDPGQSGWADAGCDQLQPYICRHPA